MKKTVENQRFHQEKWRQTRKITKFCFVFLFVAFLQVSAKTYSQEVKLALKVSNASLEHVMNSIRSQSEFSFFFDDAAVKKISNITLDVQIGRAHV